MTPLVVRGLTVRLGAQTVLSGVDLSVEAGQIVGVFGPSGAGKSTLFATLAGEIAPDAGEVRLFGEPAMGPLWERARRGLGYLPQGPSVLWDLSVEDNLAVFRSTRSAPGREDWLERLDLTARRATPSRALSGGERRRLELVRVLVGEPRVLLCDEPFAALDPDGAERVGHELRALADRGCAVVMADHRIGIALPGCDRACLLSGGKVTVETDATTFLETPEVQAYYRQVSDL